jgi:hypothetical protein
MLNTCPWDNNCLLFRNTVPDKKHDTNSEQSRFAVTASSNPVLDTDAGDTAVFTNAATGAYETVNACTTSPVQLKMSLLQAFMVLPDGHVVEHGSIQSTQRLTPLLPHICVFQRCFRHTTEYVPPLRTLFNIVSTVSGLSHLKYDGCTAEPDQLPNSIEAGGGTECGE